MYLYICEALGNIWTDLSYQILKRTSYKLFFPDTSFLMFWVRVDESRSDWFIVGESGSKWTKIKSVCISFFRCSFTRAQSGSEWVRAYFTNTTKNLESTMWLTVTLNSVASAVSKFIQTGSRRAHPRRKQSKYRNSFNFVQIGENPPYPRKNKRDFRHFEVTCGRLKLFSRWFSTNAIDMVFNLGDRVSRKPCRKPNLDRLNRKSMPKTLSRSP